MLKQVFLAYFEPVVTRFGPWKMPKCLEKGLCCDQKWVKNGSKMRFSKPHPGLFEGLRQVFFAHFVPVRTRFGPWKIPTCLEKGPFWDQKWIKHATKSALGPFRVLKQVFLAHFEPVVTHFGPWKIPKCLEKHGFATKNGSKIGQKRASPKVTLHHSGFSKNCFLPILYQWVGVSARGKSQHALKRGRFGTKKGIKHATKSALGPFGVLKQVFLAHFEPVVMRFGP